MYLPMDLDWHPSSVCSPGKHQTARQSFRHGTHRTPRGAGMKCVMTMKKQLTGKLIMIILETFSIDDCEFEVS